MRPTTSNPKRQTFATSQLASESSFQTDGVLGSPARPSGMQLDPSVIWSAEEGGVPENMLARPHTSNPRYVERSQRDVSPTSNKAPNSSHTFSSPISPSGRINLPLTNGGTTASQTNPSSNGPTPITTSRVHRADESENAPSPCHATDDNFNSPQHHNKVYEGPTVGVIWASDSYSVDPQLLARPVTSNPWLQRVFESVEPLEGGEMECHINNNSVPYDSSPSPVASRERRRSQILWSSADVNDWRMLARPHTSNPLLEKGLDSRGPGMDERGGDDENKGSKILWRREETVEEMQEIIHAQDTRIRHLESAVLQLRTQLNQKRRSEQQQQYSPYHQQAHHDEAYNSRGEASPLVSSAYSSPAPPPAADKLLPYRSLNSDGKPSNLSEAHVLSFEVEDPSRALMREDISDNDEAPPSPIPNPRSTSSCSQQQRPPVLLSDAETERFIRTNVSLAGGDSTIDEYNRMKSELRNEARFGVRVPTSPDDDGFSDHTGYRPTSAGRPESALPSRRAARLRQTVHQCRPNTAISSSRRVPNDNSVANVGAEKAVAARPMSARPMTNTTWQSHPSNKVGEPLSLRAFLENQSTPCFTQLNAQSSLTGTKAMGCLTDSTFSQEYAKLLRRGETNVLKDDFKELYLERAEEFGVTVSDREVERKMERFDSVGVNYLSPQEFAILYLKVAQW